MENGLQVAKLLIQTSSTQLKNDFLLNSVRSGEASEIHILIIVWRRAKGDS